MASHTTEDVRAEGSTKGTKRRRWVLVTVLLALPAALMIYLVVWASTTRFIVVREGHLYRSAELAPEKLVEYCRRHGIRTVVDFRETGPKTEAQAGALREAAIRYVHLPTEQLPGPGILEGFLAVMADEENLPVLIHCQHGVGRTGLHAAIYRIEFEGWSHEKARWEAMILAGFDSFQKRTPKGMFILEYTPSGLHEGTVQTEAAGVVTLQ